MIKVPEQQRQPMLANGTSSVNRAMVARVAALTTAVHRAQLTHKMAARWQGRGRCAGPSFRVRFTEIFPTKLVDEDGIHSRGKFTGLRLALPLREPVL